MLKICLRLREEKLPPIEAFYDSLYDFQCTNANNENAKRVWAKGIGKNEKDYCKKYLSSDFLTLLDIVCDNAPMKSRTKLSLI